LGEQQLNDHAVTPAAIQLSVTAMNTLQEPAMATTPESFVDALNSAFGKQTTQRAAHAKGVVGGGASLCGEPAGVWPGFNLLRIREAAKLKIITPISAAIGMLFDWLVVGQVLAVNPAHAVRGPKHVVRRGKTPVLTEDQARRLLESIKVAKQVTLPDGSVAERPSVVGLRDRALIGVMIYSFARIGAHQTPVADIRRLITRQTVKPSRLCFR
jgi:hypothetical protein